MIKKKSPNYLHFLSKDPKDKLKHLTDKLKFKGKEKLESFFSLKFYNSPSSSPLSALRPLSCWNKVKTKEVSSY